MRKFFRWLRYLILRAYYRRLYRKICLVMLQKNGDIYLSEEHFCGITGREWGIYQMPVSFREFPEGLGKGHIPEFERRYGSPSVSKKS